MSQEIVVTPKHAWFKNTQLIITENGRLWKKVKTGEIITEFIRSDKFNIKDFQLCFSFLSTEYSVDNKIALDILNTPITRPLKIYHYDVGMVCTGVVERLETSHPVNLEEPIVNYESLFNVIGSDYPPDIIHVKTLEGEQKQVRGYPDSVILQLDYTEEGNLYYGYGR